MNRLEREARFYFERLRAGEPALTIGIEQALDELAVARSKPLLELRIAGLPVPQGSKRVVPTKQGHRLIEGNEKTLKPWRSTIALEAADAFDDQPTREAVRVSLRFTFPRPSSHFGTGRNAGTLKASAPAYKTTKPDLDKLIRAILDGLTGVAFVDDAQVAELVASKDFGPAGVWIRVEFADVFAELEVAESPVAA